MREPGVQRDGKKGATNTPNPILPPVLTPENGARRPQFCRLPNAPPSSCFSNSGLHKRMATRAELPKESTSQVLLLQISLAMASSL